MLVQQLILEPVGHEAFTLDLTGAFITLFYATLHNILCSNYTGDLAKLKGSPIIIKEGCEYRVKIVFRVQRDIVAGLRYQQQSYRKGIKGSI